MQTTSSYLRNSQCAELLELVEPFSSIDQTAGIRALLLVMSLHLSSRVAVQFSEPAVISYDQKALTLSRMQATFQAQANR